MAVEKQNPIELLAPAKNLDIGIAAINCGADAIYVGVEKFGARDAAGNTLQDVEKLIHYARRYWAKTYITINTLLHDNELTEAVRTIGRLYEMGADAIIIQDVGLLQCDLPPIPLFASTQMHNYSVERILFLEKIGIARVILARELSLEQIRHIRRQTILELESFIHGALCVCFSGQCYMSYALGGRSANRGQCAQPCRKPYTLVNGDGQIIAKQKHLLSLRDLNLSDHLKTLIEAGITSFKIEGRLKDKSYVMNVVGHYRKLLDQISLQLNLQTSSSGRVYFDFEPNPVKSFNRGFTEFFLIGRQWPLTTPNTPKSIGEPIGKIRQIAENHVDLEGAESLHTGDGVCFFDRKGLLLGTVVNRVDGDKIYLQKMTGLTRGTEIYRNFDRQFVAKLEKSKTYRKIDITLVLRHNNGALELRARDENGIEASVRITGDWKTANQTQTTQTTIQTQLAKCGGSPFKCCHIDQHQASVFIPIAQLNQLRRSALNALLLERDKKRPQKKSTILRNNIPFPEKFLTFTGNVLNERAKEFYRQHGVEHITPGAETGLELQNHKVMTTKLCLNYEMGFCAGKSTAQKSREPLYLMDENGVKLKLCFNCRECEMEVYLESKPSGNPRQRKTDCIKGPNPQQKNLTFVIER